VLQVTEYKQIQIIDKTTIHDYRETGGGKMLDTWDLKDGLNLGEIKQMSNRSLGRMLMYVYPSRSKLREPAWKLSAALYA